MDDYLAAVAPDQGARIIIDGEPVFVARRRLLGHLQLSQLDLQMRAGGRPVELAAHVIEYLSAAGLTDEQLKKASVYELLEAFFALKRLNAWQWILPWLEKPSDPGKAEIYDYKGRQWAVWVHKLASRYGWAPETIWALWPEEAAAYMQEIMVSEYHERENNRALSEVSYRYDKATKTSRFIPTPMPGWMVDNRPPPTVRIPRRALPVGNVIKLDN